MPILPPEATTHGYGDSTLPRNWVWTTIGAITDSIQTVDPTKAPDTEFSYLDISSIDNTVNKITEPKAYRGSNAPSRARQLVRTGDVLLSTVRTYLRNIAQVPETYDSQIASTGFSILRGQTGVSSTFIFYYCLTDGFLASLGALQRGVSYPAVRDSDVRRQPIPLPPLPEQHRIIAEIDRLFSHLDAGVTALKQLQAKLKRYRAAVLKAACEGRLVPQDPAAEPASVLLTRILQERRKRWEIDQRAKGKDLAKTKYDEPSGVFPSDQLILPTSWTLASLAQCSMRITDGTHQPPQFVETGVPFLFIRHVVSGSISFEDTKFISEDTYRQLNSRCPVQLGDILYTAVGSYGVAIPVTTDRPFSFQRHIAHIKPVPSLSERYLAIYLNSEFGLKQAHRVARGVAQKTVTLGDLAQFVIALPPLPEQKRIVAEVERRLSVVLNMETSVALNLKRAERLRQSILKQAFQGKLVPQDPRDEPATELLARMNNTQSRQAHSVRDSGNRRQSSRNKSGGNMDQQLRLKLPLLDVLREAGAALTPDELFRRAGFTWENVDEFYEELRLLIAENTVEEIRPDTTDVFLKAS